MVISPPRLNRAKLHQPLTATAIYQSYVARVLAHIEWLAESHRVGGDVHGNDWDHWFAALRRLPEELHRRIADRAYFLWLEASRQTGAEIHGKNAEFWRDAESEELAGFMRRLSLRAYYIWLDECGRMQDIVHGNDWFHWFEAELQEIESEARRLLPSRIAFSHGGSNGRDSVSDCCHSSSGKGMLPERNTALGDLSAAPDQRQQVDLGKQPKIAVNSRDGSKRMDNLPLPNGPKCQPEVGWTDDDFEEVAEAFDGAYEIAIHGQSFATVDLSSEEFANKVVATDTAQTVVLAVANSLPELIELTRSPEFQAKIRQEHGSQIQCSLHLGRYNSTAGECEG